MKPASRIFCRMIEYDRRLFWPIINLILVSDLRFWIAQAFLFASESKDVRADLRHRHCTARSDRMTHSQAHQSDNHADECGNLLSYFQVPSEHSKRRTFHIQYFPIPFPFSSSASTPSSWWAQRRTYFMSRPASNEAILFLGCFYLTCSSWIIPLDLDMRGYTTAYNWIQPHTTAYDCMTSELAAERAADSVQSWLHSWNDLEHSLFLSESE